MLVVFRDDFLLSQEGAFKNCILHHSVQQSGPALEAFLWGCQTHQDEQQWLGTRHSVTASWQWGGFQASWTQEWVGGKADQCQRSAHCALLVTPWHERNQAGESATEQGSGNGSSIPAWGPSRRGAQFSQIALRLPLPAVQGGIDHSPITLLHVCVDQAKLPPLPRQLLKTVMADESLWNVFLKSRKFGHHSCKACSQSSQGMLQYSKIGTIEESNARDLLGLQFKYTFVYPKNHDVPINSSWKGAFGRNRKREFPWNITFTQDSLIEHLFYVARAQPRNHAK